jgi:hypothetical protein
MEKRGTVWFVDITHNGFILHLKSKIKKARAGEVGCTRKKRKESLKEKRIKELTRQETEHLQELSIQADLSKSITALRLENYKIETQKLKLEQQAGDLISRSMADFLYMGYLSRLNRELLTCQNKLEASYEKLIANLIVRVQDGEDVKAIVIAKEMKDININETEDIIKVIKQSQLDQLKQFAKDAGFTL